MVVPFDGEMLEYVCVVCGATQAQQLRSRYAIQLAAALKFVEAEVRLQLY